jgi:hypothetical protein
LTQTELSQLPGAGKKFTITAELMDFGDSRTWNNQVEFKLNLKNPKLRGPESFWCPENVAEELKDSIGQIVALDLLSDQVKPDKEQDDRHWNYWCKVTGIHRASSTTTEEEPEQPTPDKRKPVTDSGKFKGSPFPQVLGEIQGHLEKLAMDWFTGSFTPAELRQVPHHIALHTLRLMRDELFWDLKSHAIAPEHYCYDHEMSRARGKSGGWGHPLEGGQWCIEPEEPSPPANPDDLEGWDEADAWPEPVSDEVDF